jgi:hypothetical protein
MKTNDADPFNCALTGSEGVIGVASFLGGESTPSQAVVLSTGYAYRLEADLVKNEFEHDGPLPHLLLRYTQALIAQTGQIAVCNRYHSLEQQLCRWILSSLDRLPSSELAMTHELIAHMLGVRRESVTEAAVDNRGQTTISCSAEHNAGPVSMHCLLLPVSVVPPFLATFTWMTTSQRCFRKKSWSVPYYPERHTGGYFPDGNRRMLGLD